MFKSEKLLFNFWKYLSRKRKRQVLFTLFICILTGVFEIITINSALPFLSVLTGSKDLSNYPISILLSKILNIPINEELIVPVIIFFCINITISTILRLLNIWQINIISALIGIDLSVKALSNIVYQPYTYHINNSSSKVITSNTLYIDRASTGIISSLLFISNLILTLTMIIAIFFMNPYLAISSLLIISNIYFLLAKKLNNKVKINGKKIALSQKSKVKYIQEVIGSIRSVLLDSNQEIYINEVKRVDRKHRMGFAQNNFISEFPRFAIECITLLLIAITSLIILGRDNGESNLSFIVLLGSFTLAIQRLLPVVQRVYSSLTTIKSVSTETEIIYKILQMKAEGNIKKRIVPLKFEKSIILESVDFSYVGERQIISNLNLEIKKGQKIGIIGKTGSGKSTLLDMIIGLLEPSNGRVLVDGKDINNKKYPRRKNKWMLTISHVPQDIFLKEGTIAENIAFGIKEDFYSMRRIINAAKKAQIHEFIESTAKGYQSYVGERGIKLSGGQRQRIGIARALYKKTSILILDEATSALDNTTEIELMKSINGNNKEITIISIAHRHSTLKDFDRIIKIENGFIIKDGKPKEIL